MDDKLLLDKIQGRLEGFDSLKKFREHCCELMDYLTPDDFVDWYVEIFVLSSKTENENVHRRVYFLKKTLESFSEDFFARWTVSIINCCEKENWQIDIEELPDFVRLKKHLKKAAKEKKWGTIVAKRKGKTALSWPPSQHFLPDQDTRYGSDR